MLGMTLERLTQAAVSQDCRTDHDALGASDGFDRRLGTDDQMASLVRTIESEIIPRLMLAHRDLPNGLMPFSTAPKVIADGDVVDFAKIVLTDDVVIALAYVESLRARGVSIEMLCLDLLAPTARRLGALWEADLCDFIEVTIGLGRIQQVLRELSPAFQNRGSESGVKADRRIVLAPAPGDQHSLGLLMVREFFRRAGWDVRGGIDQQAEGLAATVRSEWFDAVGFSVGSECRLEQLTACVKAIRETSRNRAIGILVGGPIFVTHPEYVSLVGADVTAPDAKSAVVEAENLVTSRR